MMYYLDKELLKFLMQDDICLFVVCVNGNILGENESQSGNIVTSFSLRIPKPEDYDTFKKSRHILNFCLNPVLNFTT